MRLSDWQIQWDVTGASPRVLLDFDDVMESEISRDLEQLVDVAAFDFAVSSVVAGRKNVKRRMEIGRRVPQTYRDESWDACHEALLSDPWGLKAIISIRPRDSIARFRAAALMSSSHAPFSGGPGPESLHSSVYRVAPVSALALPGGIVIVGGHFNAPSSYVITLPPGVGLPPGTNVNVTDSPGLPDGSYVVGGGGLEPGEEGEVELEPVDDPSPVANISAPTISAGSTGPGDTVLRTAGVWSNAFTVTGQWYFRAIATGIGASAFQIPTDVEDGDAIFWQEIGTGLGGDSAGAQSNILYGEELPFINLSPPAIEGGEVEIIATPGAWQSADDVTGEWFFKGVGDVIFSATGETSLIYSIPTDPEDGDQWYYKETAHKEGSADLTASSNIYTYQAYDASPMILPAADIWVSYFDSSGVDTFIGRRIATMAVEWRGMPTGTTIEVFPLGPAAATGDGSVTDQIEMQVRATVDPGVGSGSSLSLFASDLDGRDFAAAGNETFDEFTAADRLVKYTNVSASDADNIWVIVRDSSETIIANFVIIPAFSTTHRMRAAASTEVTQASGRSVRLVYNAGAINLLMPAGFALFAP